MGDNGDRPYSRDIEAAIEDNLIACWASFGSYPEVDLYRGGDMMRFVSGVDYPLCNNVFDARIEGGGIDGIIAKTLEIFRSRGLPMLWWTGPSTRPENLGEILLEKGLSLAQEAPGMALALPAEMKGPETPAGLSVQPVRDEESLELWRRVFMQAFEVPDFVGDFFAAIMEHLGLGEGKPLRHCLALLAGEPVACATLYTHEGVAGIYNVATLEESRGKGIGSLLSWRMIEEGQSSGCDLAILHATPMGLPVYEKLGFEEHCTIRAYMMDK